MGWYGGAALGVKLALDKGVPNSGRFVAAIVGDGTFLFAVPSSVYWMSRRYKVPFLTIVINNKGIYLFTLGPTPSEIHNTDNPAGWNAPLRSALLVHPDGLASKATNDELCIEFSPSPDYAGIAKAAAGGEIWAGKAESVDDLEGLMKEAIEYVKGGKSAVLEVVVYGTGI